MVLSEVTTRVEAHGHNTVVDIFAGDSIEITKDFGPWAVSPIRVTLDYEKAAWVIERQDDHTGEWQTVYELVVE